MSNRLGLNEKAQPGNCASCKHLTAALSWWCTSKEASAFRGTTIPGVNDCPFWEEAPPTMTRRIVKLIAKG